MIWLWLLPAILGGVALLYLLVAVGLFAGLMWLCEQEEKDENR